MTRSSSSQTVEMSEEGILVVLNTRNVLLILSLPCRPQLVDWQPAVRIHFSRPKLEFARRLLDREEVHILEAVATADGCLLRRTREGTIDLMRLDDQPEFLLHLATSGFLGIVVRLDVTGRADIPPARIGVLLHRSFLQHDQLLLHIDEPNMDAAMPVAIPMHQRALLPHARGSRSILEHVEPSGWWRLHHFEHLVIVLRHGLCHLWEYFSLA
mmetsp:Transcript_2338/g.6457  ORF Transcript_2338/g.6457 Transcript_2338/m.6457 type:complete len:213 (-) Transcript_2338:258-896(-)